MASTLPNAKVPRARPLHYYEGMMKKKGPGEKVYNEFWSGLLGNAMYFYNHHKDTQYVDVINLDDFVSLLDDNSRCKIPTESKMTLQLRDRTIYLIVGSTELREMWKGFILTVTQLKVPSGLSLLPGPRHMMSEVVVKELERRAELEQERIAEQERNGNYDEANYEEMLPCFYKVSRLEAQEWLEKYPEYGNLIMRPSQNNTGVSVTTCQKCHGKNLIRHYRVIERDGSYIIEVDQAVHCKSLLDVMKYFVEKTNGVLIPFHMNDYEEHLSFVVTNEENGETMSKKAERPQDSQITPGFRVNSLPPPPLPSSPLPDEEDEKAEDDDIEYINDAKSNVSPGRADNRTLNRVLPRVTVKPTSPLDHSEAISRRWRYYKDPSTDRKLPSTPPPLPKPVPRPRDFTDKWMPTTRVPELPQRTTPLQQIPISRPNSGVNEDFKKKLEMLQIRNNRY